MKRFFYAIIGLICLTAVVPRMSSADELWEMDAQRSNILFSGQSTLHSFQGNVLQMNGYLKIDQKGETSNATGRVAAAADKLDTQNVKRDRNMKKMLAVAQYPEIVFEITSIDVPSVDGEDRICRLQGELKIAGKGNRVESEGHCLRGEDRLSLIGAFDVSLAQYGLRPPSVLGVIRVGDLVHVDFDVTFHKPSAKEK